MRETRETERRKRERARRYEREDLGGYGRRPARRERPVRREGRRRERSSFAKNLPLILTGLVIAAVAIVLLGTSLFKEIGGSKEKADLNEYLGIDPSLGTAVILNGEVSEEKAVIQGDTPYISMAMANKFYDNFYYDSLEGHLLVTGATKAVEGTEGSDYIVQQDAVFISIPFLRRFAPLSYEIYEDPERVDISTGTDPVTSAELAEDTELRESADKKSAILVDLDKGDEIEVLEEEEAWASVRYQGISGYIETKRLKDDRNSVPSGVSGGEEADLTYTRNVRDHKIVLGFHNLAVSDANSYLDDATAITKGMNVIAPTWFSMADNEGAISDIASADYVAKAHEMGYEVWGVVDNFTNPVDTNEVLSRTSKRLVLEQNILSAAMTYGLEGINIDFEQLAGETGDDFAQFLRELSIYTRANGIVLSVDNYVPQDYTDFYRRDIQGRVADYVIIMGYDEHTAVSNEAGSVASLGFVTQGIEDTLKEVPADQVINAIPFYTRKWSYEGGSLSCESLGMRDAAAFLSDNNVTATWDAEACQNYASFEKDGVTYSIWLEDAESISSKLAVMTAHDLGGVGCWKLGQETADIWDTISTYYPSGS